jgi:hypothetical protein
MLNREVGFALNNDQPGLSGPKGATTDSCTGGMELFIPLSNQNN